MSRKPANRDIDVWLIVFCVALFLFTLAAHVGTIKP